MQTTYKWRDFEFTFTVSEQDACLPGSWFRGTLTCGAESCDVKAWWYMYGKPLCHEALDWVVGEALIGNKAREQAFLESIGFPIADYYHITLEG